jgi:hypothetical protein
MATIYLINVGANSRHRAVARSPVFDDGRFVYVSFPTRDKAANSSSYSGAARSYVSNPDKWRTHADPDWENLTYGHYCANPRALSLKRVCPGDTLLFWGMLWEHSGAGWSGFKDEREWYLFGALRISEVLPGGAHVNVLSKEARTRALRNAHLSGRMLLEEDHYVFIGDRRKSAIFGHAVPLETSRPDGLIYRACTSADGVALAMGTKPAWKSSLRCCRPMWKLEDPKARSRAKLLAAAISQRNDYDLLDGI